MLFSHARLAHIGARSLRRRMCRTIEYVGMEALVGASPRLPSAALAWEGRLAAAGSLA